MNWRLMYRPMAGSPPAALLGKSRELLVRRAAQALETMGLCRWESEGGSLGRERASAVRRHAFPRDPRGFR